MYIELYLGASVKGFIYLALRCQHSLEIFCGKKYARIQAYYNMDLYPIPFLWPSNISLCGYTTISLSTEQLIFIEVVSIFDYHL